MDRLILDTHFVVWLAIRPDKLSRAEREYLDGDGQELLISTISLWEIRMKWQADRRRHRPDEMPTPAATITFAVENDIAIMPLTVEDCVATLQTPLDHIDPFDEMLLVHAQQLNAKLLTRDRKLAGHPLALLP